MINLKPYEEYENTELFWLEKIPAHWNLRKIKHLFYERIEKGYPEQPLLAATQSKGVIPKELYENRTVLAQKDLHLLKLVKKGDFVISLRSFQGGIEYAYYQGIISPAYTVIRTNSTMESGYFRHLAKSKRFLELLKHCVTGIREGQNIDYGVLKNSHIPVPPKEEQDQIVRFLDSKLLKINKFIKNKKKLIELLKEKKQAIINQAVTKGLDPDAKMKPSGVEWLGDVPEGWEKLRFKNIANLKSIKNNINEELLSVFLNAGVIKYSDSNNMQVHKPSLDLSNYQLVEPGDLVMNNQQAWRGSVGVSKYKGIISPAYFVFHLSDRINSSYANYMFRNRHMVAFYVLASKGVGSIQRMLKYDDLMNITIYLPNKLEQTAISEYIFKQTQGIDKTINRVTKEIELITEYRTSLISAVVTGQVDVRDIHIEEPQEVLEEQFEAMNEELPVAEEISESEAI